MTVTETQPIANLSIVDFSIMLFQSLKKRKKKDMTQTARSDWLHPDASVRDALQDRSDWPCELPRHDMKGQHFATFYGPQLCGSPKMYSACVLGQQLH